MLRTPVSSLAAVALLASTAHAQTMVGPTDDVEGAIASAGPGDEIVLAGGMYTLDERFSFDIAGTEAEPIIIRAAEGEVPHLHRPGSGQNIIDIDGAEWVTIRGIEFSGGSAGLRVSRASNFTIEDCEVHDTGDVALRFNDGGTYESIRILRNHIHHTNNTGEGMYLGCNNDGCRLANSLIEGNYIHDTNQASVDQGDGIEMKEGGYGNIFRDNVIRGTNYPCMLIDSTVGNGPPNIVERNLLWNCGDHGIQLSGNAIVRNNIILSANSDGIAAQPHQNGNVENLVIVNNTVIDADGDALTIRSASGFVLVANNALYSRDGSALRVVGGDSSQVTIEGNVGEGGGPGSGFAASTMADFIDGNYSGAPPIDLFPEASGALVGNGVSAHLPGDDFNGTVRVGAADVGAYAFDPAGNPGWTLADSFKDGTPPPPVMPGTDAGTPPPRTDGGTVTPPPGTDGGATTPPPGGGDDSGCSVTAARSRHGLGAILGVTILGVLGLSLLRLRERHR